MRARVFRFLAALGLLPFALALAGCGSGSAGVPSTVTVASPSPAAAALNMALLAHLDLATLAQGPVVAAPVTGTEAAALSAAGNWGYTTAGGRRFALTGLSTGTSIVEVTDAAHPRNVGPRGRAGQPVARDPDLRRIRVHHHGGALGLDIISMKDPDHPRKIQTWNKTFRTAHSLWIDTDRGLLFVNGSNGRTGRDARPRHRVEPRGSQRGRRVHGLLHPRLLHPRQRALRLRDQRRDRGAPGRQRSRRIREITRFFTGGRFTHNSWLTRDGRYLFTTDERTGMPVEGWDITTPTAPRKVTQFIANPAAIAHNVLIDGDRLLVSHYTEGVYLLDIRNPEQPRVIGSYDTYPGASGGFNGTWGAYIFPASNLIVASDISGGLFVLAYTGS